MSNDTKPRLTNPYEGIEKLEAVNGILPYIRVATTTSTDDIMTIKKVFLNDGWRMSIMNLMFKKIADHCRANNYTFEDAPALEEYVLSLVTNVSTTKTKKKKA